MAKGDARAFLGAFLRNPGAVGAVAPSSAALARAMVRGVSSGPGQLIVEFGPGTGALTREIRDILPHPDCYLGIELEGRFVELLGPRFPDMAFVHGCASDAVRIVAERGARPVKAILSGLPFASLPIRVQNGIVASVDSLLGPGGIFRTFQYVHAYGLPNAVKFRRRMREVFGAHERSRAVFGNIPPAYTLTWRR